MSKIIDRAGSGIPLSDVVNDSNLDSLHGINQVVAGTTHTVDITDQGDTLEFTNAGAVAVTLDDIGTIQGAAHTSDFHVTLIATNAATVATITPNGANSFNTGVATIVLTVDEYVTLEIDSTGLVWNIISSSDALQVGGLSATQFIRSDANDTASGDLDLTGAVDLQGTWEIGSVQVTSTAADINDLVDKSSAQTITEEKTFDANIVFDASVTERRIQFNGGTELTWLAGLANGDIVLWDNTNSRAVFFYEPALDTFTARNLNALNAVLTTPALTNATGSLSSPALTTPTINGVTGSGIEFIASQQQLVTATAIQASTTFDMSAAGGAAATAATNGATAAILKVSCYATTNSAAHGTCSVYVSTGGVTTTNQTTLSAQVDCYGNPDYGHDLNTIVVPLDGNSDFNYAISNVACNTLQVYIHFVGYYV